MTSVMIRIGTVSARQRKLLLVALGLFALYSVVGFFVVPPLARRYILRTFDETLGVEAQLDRVRTNPYTLRATLEGFRAHERSGGDLVAFDELTVNLQVSSLIRRAWVFKRIRLVAPRITVAVAEDGTLNLTALAPDEPAPPEEPPAEEQGLPRLVVGTFELERGQVDLVDRTHATPFETRLGPASLVLSDFSTLPDREGRLAFEATFESSAHVTWEGTLAVNPIRSAGRLSIERGRVGLPWRYLQDRLRFRLTDGRYDLGLEYEAALEEAGVHTTVRGGTLAMRDLVFQPLEQDVEVLRVPELDLGGVGLEWPAGRLTIDSVRLAQPQVTLWLESDGSFVQGRMATLEDDPAAAAGAPAAPPPVEEPSADSFSVEIGRLAIENLSGTFEDRAAAPPFRVEVQGLGLAAQQLGTEPGRASPFKLDLALASGGSAQFDGTLTMLPDFTIDAAAKLDAVSLVPLETYLAGVGRMKLHSAAVSLDGRLKSTPEERLHYRGKAALDELSIEDTRKGERLLGLGHGEAADALYELGRGRLRMASVTLVRPYTRLTIYEDQTTNVGDVFAEDTAPGESVPAAASAPSSPSDEGGMLVEIGEVKIRDGSADFADLSLPLPFAAQIAALEGSISEISSAGSSARIDAEGRVDEHGLVKVEGSLDFFAPDRRSDLGVAFRNVEMSRLSPYSRKFVGYAVESGRLSYDLRYKLDNRTLASQNDIVIEQLTLGEKVDSPDAPNLPVRLAVAMLKDRNGRIDLDIPVSGTLDDPEFSYRKVVWQAIKNVLSKVATAPFLALGKLIGIEGKDLEFVEFAPASGEIAPPAREKLSQLAQALGERPELVLEVRGVFDEEIDAAELKRQKVDSAVEAKIATLPPAAGDEPRLASEARRTALEALFAERFSAVELAAVTAQFTQAPGVAAGDPSAAAAGAAPPFDLSAYLDALHARIAETEAVPEADLTALADGRAAAIRDFLLSGELAVPAERITMLPSETLKRGGDNWVRVKLALTS
jgi:uncharacterized protein involved in outer membrane biogenesis